MSVGILDFSVDNNQLGFVTWELRAVPFVQAISNMRLERNRPQAKSCLRLTQFSYPKNGILIPSSCRLSASMYAKELARYLVHSMCFKLQPLSTPASPPPSPSVLWTVLCGHFKGFLQGFLPIMPPHQPLTSSVLTLSIRNLSICFRSCWKFLGREPSNSVYSHLIY